MPASIYSSQLKPYEIRLVSIEAGKPNDEVRCTLESAISLNHALSYHTLSYCWGDPSRIELISCNGITFKATGSLVAALKRSRLTYLSTTSFWIDAICIN
jgi:hypothetical protein